MNAIFTRRSIRKYTAEKIPAELLKKLLEAAMSAPSAGNQQPWQFLVIQEREMLAKIADVSPYAKMTKDAAAAIMVCGDLAREKFVGFWVQDCSAAIENLLLEATDSGLGAVWLGMYPLIDRVDLLRQLFQLPDQIVPLAVIALGYPAETKPPQNRYHETNVHWETW